MHAVTVACPLNVKRDKMSMLSFYSLSDCTQGDAYQGAVLDKYLRIRRVLLWTNYYAPDMAGWVMVQHES